MIAAFFRGVNMKEGGKKSWNGKTLGKLKDEYEQLGVKLEECEKHYEPIQKLVEIPGLRKITFRLNPISYFKLNDFSKKAEKEVQEARQTLQKYKDQNNNEIFDSYTIIKKMEDNLKEKEILQKRATTHIDELHTKQVTEILDKNIQKFEELIKNQNPRERDSLEDLVNSGGELTMYFGATDIEDAEGYTDPTTGHVYIRC